MDIGIVIGKMKTKRKYLKETIIKLKKEEKKMLQNKDKDKEVFILRLMFH